MEYKFEQKWKKNNGGYGGGGEGARPSPLCQDAFLNDNDSGENVNLKMSYQQDTSFFQNVDSQTPGSEYCQPFPPPFQEALSVRKERMSCNFILHHDHTDLMNRKKVS